MFRRWCKINIRAMSNNNFGFTLIEVMLVTAVGGLLLVIALAGEQQLQGQARFDGAVDKTIQNIAYARNFATSHVNDVGGGNDTTTVTAGTALEFNNDHYDEGFPLEEITTMYGLPDATGNLDLTTLSELPSGGIAACAAAQHPDDNDECEEQFLELSDHLTVSGDSISTWGQILYVNNGPELLVCNRPDSSGLSESDACAMPATSPIDLTLSDLSGFSAKIEIDPHTGFAKRL